MKEPRKARVMESERDEDRLYSGLTKTEITKCKSYHDYIEETNLEKKKNKKKGRKGGRERKREREESERASSQANKQA